jgi:hypothetical protein
MIMKLTFTFSNAIIVFRIAISVLNSLNPIFEYQSLIPPVWSILFLDDKEHLEKP